MAGRLSFSIAVNLLTENFKKGASSVSNSLKSMQMQVLTFAAALGAGGLSITGFLTSLIRTARETSRVITALKNVSGGAANYAKSQQFLLDLAKKYGIELLALTGNFAKFTAAASNAGVAMADQKKIFESVSRASVAFGLTAEDTNLTFLAITQMMSKGKISSEELRRQLGERLPIAMSAMAKAAGVPINKLDKLLSQGKLMSNEVLPKFADALNEMIPSVNTDNIETSINRLKNAFTEFTKGTGIQNTFKKIVDISTSAISNIRSTFSGMVAFIISIIGGKLIQSVSSFFKKESIILDKAVRDHEVAETQKAVATQRRVAAEESYLKVRIASETMADGKRLASAAQVNKALQVLEAARVTEKKAFDNARLTSEKATAVQSLTALKRGQVIMMSGLAKVASSLRALWSTVWPMLLITAIAAVISKLVNMYTEAKRVKGIFDDYKKGLEQSGNTEEVTKMQALLDIMNDRNRSQTEINNAQSELQKMLGIEKTSQADLNGLVKKRIELLKNAARAEYAANELAAAEGSNRELSAKTGLSESQMDRLAKLYQGKDTSTQNKDYYYQAAQQEYRKNGTKYYNRNSLDSALEEYAQNMRKIADATNVMAKTQVSTTETKATPYIEDDKKKKTELQKSEEKYKESLRELQAQLELNTQSGGKIGLSQQEYNKAVDELRVKTLVDAKGTGDKELLTSKYLKTLEDAIKHPLYNETQDKLDQARKSYAEGLIALNNQRDTGVISEKTYRSELIKLIDETIKTTGAIKGIGVEGLTFISSLQSTAASMTVLPKAKVRDTTYDYKKTRADIAGEELGISKDNLDRILESMKPKLGELADELNDALEIADFNEALNIIKAIKGVDALKDSIDKVKGLDSVLKLETVKQDIKDLNKDLRATAYSGIKDMASSTDRMVSAFSSLSEAFSNTDTSAWERIMAIWNAITTSVDAALSVISTIEQITEIINKLAVAKEAEAAIDTATTSTKVANAGTQAAAATTAAAAQTTAELTASSLKTTAATTEMAAKSTAAYAGIPFLGVGLAASQIATMQAMIAAAAIPKFENGGIVGGSSYHGDKILARVNSGELILNRQQQSTLFGLMNQNSISKSGDNKVIVRGSDLILSINNELKHRNKKPIL